jgi:hypothetical protein
VPTYIFNWGESGTWNAREHGIYGGKPKRHGPRRARSADSETVQGVGLLGYKLLVSRPLLLGSHWKAGEVESETESLKAFRTSMNTYSVQSTCIEYLDENLYKLHLNLPKGVISIQDPLATFIIFVTNARQLIIYKCLATVRCTVPGKAVSPFPPPHHDIKQQTSDFRHPTSTSDPSHSHFLRLQCRK